MFAEKPRTNICYNFIGDTTSDYRYCIPEGLNVLSCGGSCLLNFNTKIISGNKTYYESLGGKVSSTFKAWGGSFGASVDYDHIEEYTESGRNVFTQSEAACCVYTADIDYFAHPKFDDGFILNVAELTEEYDPAIYRR